MNSKPTLSIVVCGWHFQNVALFAALRQEAASQTQLDARFYVASHKSAAEVDPALIRQLQSDRWQVLWFENEGWEWMAYQQFMRHQEKNGESSDYYLFLHDDIEIRKPGYIGRCMEMVAEGVRLVGNSPSAAPETQSKVYFPEDALLIENTWGPLKVDRWKVVRGSFFFTTQEIAREILGKMPVKRGKRIELANASLRIFGALVTDRYGLESIRYLGDAPRSSEYVYEEFRGGAQARKRLRDLLPRAVKRALKAIRYGREGPDLPPGFGLKINLGCGNDPLPRYFNVDFSAPPTPVPAEVADGNPASRKADYFNADYADANANVLELTFADGSLAEIMLIHVVEHLNRRDAELMVRKFHRWLKPGGQLVMEFPDVVKVARFVSKMKNDPKALTESPYGLRGFYGGHDSPRGHEHRWGWTGSTMGELLRQVGFPRIYVERARFHSRKRDVRVRAIR